MLEANNYKNCSIIKDLNGKDRIAKAKK
jgi:hypothetical protein